METKIGCFVVKPIINGNAVKITDEFWHTEITVLAGAELGQLIAALQEYQAEYRKMVSWRKEMEKLEKWRDNQ